MQETVQVMYISYVLAVLETEYEVHRRFMKMHDLVTPNPMVLKIQRSTHVYLTNPRVRIQHNHIVVMTPFHMGRPLIENTSNFTNVLNLFISLSPSLHKPQIVIEMVSHPTGLGEQDSEGNIIGVEQA